jgi:hypothetical protein
MQCTYNVTRRRVQESSVPWKSNVLHICECVGAHACVCVCPGVWACACACACVAMLTQRATRMRHVLTSFMASLAPPHFSTLSYTRLDFREKVTECKMCVLFSLQLLFETFLTLEVSEIWS